MSDTTSHSEWSTGPVNATYPLTYGQRALWFLHQLQPESPAYNRVNAVRIPGADFDAAAFATVFQRLTDRHDVLRTTFGVAEGEPFQQVHEYARACVRRVDAAAWSDARLRQRLAEVVYEPFDLARGPLMRLDIWRRAADEHIVVLGLHHIVTDLWSLALLMFELGALYESEKAGEAPWLPPPPSSYRDYVAWQRDLLESPRGEALRAYWLEQLRAPRPVLDLPADFTRPPTPSYQGATAWRQLSAELTHRLKQLAADHDATLYGTMLAAFQLLLYRYTGQEDILVGSPKSGRHGPSKQLLGYFVNPMVMRADLGDRPTVSQFLRRTARTVTAAIEHSDYPFPLLVETLQPERDSSRTPLFQVLFTWQKTTPVVDGQALTAFALNISGEEITLGSLLMESIGVDAWVSPFDLTLLMAEGKEGLVATFEYSTDLFRAESMERMLDHLQVLLEALVENLERPIADLPLMSPAEADQIGQWRQTAPAAEVTPPPVTSTFAARVAAAPEAPAIITPENSLTYAELDRHSDLLAHRLRRQGVTAGDTVAYFGSRSPQAIASVLAIWKAGAVYLPLNRALPEARLALILEDAGVALTLTETAPAEQLPPGAPRLLLDREGEPAGSPPPLTPLPREQDPAYIIYTSGSTGRPKGVVVSHGALARHCATIVDHYRLTPADRVLQFAELSFDQSVEQIVPPLLAGAALFMRGPELWTPDAFIRLLDDHALSVINLPPAYWQQVVERWPAGFAPPALRLVIVGGDALPAEAVRRWRSRGLPPIRLLNAYGPTETTITALTYEIPPEGPPPGREIVPIGRPLPGRTAEIVDERDRPVPIGVPGELLLGGDGVALGYLNRPEATNRVFLTDPHTGARRYRTGDRARFRSDGAIEFLGRVDQQLKLRGFRMEPGEVEAALRRHPQVEDAVVDVRSVGASKQLVGYVVADTVPRDLAAWARKWLPEYMVPGAFVALPRLPLNAAGKVDRRALPAPLVDTTAAYEAPRTPLEREIAALWAEVLGAARVGIHDNFFELGGHSLLATQIVARLRDRYQVEIPLRNLFDAPTVAALAQQVAVQTAAANDDDDLAGLLAEVEALSDEEAAALLTGLSPEGSA